MGSTILKNEGVVKTLDNGMILNQMYWTYGPNGPWAPNLNPEIKNRNLKDVLGISDVKQCFDTLRVMEDVSILALGDYIDIPKWTVSGATETTTDANFRFQIAGFNHYGPNSGILFESVNIPFKRAMTDNNSNALGYEGSDLRKLINNTFKPELEKRIGLTKPITRYLDKDQCKSGNFVTDSVYVPNYTELFGNESYQYYTGTGATESIKNSKQFQIHSVGGINSRIKNYNGSSPYYWTSSTSSGGTYYFCVCYDGGYSDYNYASNSPSGVVVAFNI